MEYGFIRALWGTTKHDGKRYYTRRLKIQNDIELVLHNKYQPKFRTYVFGEENYKYLVDMGFDCKLINSDNIVWDMATQQFRHKFEVFKEAAKDFDKFVFLDWDMIFTSPMPNDFWKTLEKKSTFQAILRIYHRRKALWRKDKTRMIPCGSFMYIGDKSIPSTLIDYWENMGRPWSEEVVAAKYTDDLMGGEFDMEKYWEMFEPTFFKLQELYSREKNETKQVCIQHCNERHVRGLLNSINKGTYEYLQKEKTIKGINL